MADALAKRFKLSQADIELRRGHTARPGGESVWRQRLRRVKYDLIKSGVLVAHPAERGVWQLVQRH